MSIDLVLPLQESLRELRRGHQWVTECLEQTMAECEQRGTELAECRQQLAEARHTLSDCEYQLAEKARLEADAVRALDSLKEQEEANRSELAQEQQKLAKAQTEVESIRLRLAAAGEREEQLQAQVDRLEADAQASRAELKDLREQFAPLLESAAEAARARGQLQAVEAELARLQAETPPGEADQQWREHFETSETTRREVEDRLNRLLADSEATRAELLALRQEFGGVTRDYAEIAQLPGQLQAVLAELARREEEPQELLEASETARQELQGQLARLLRESESTREDLNHLRDHFGPVREGYAEMAQLRGQLQVVHAELERLAEQSTGGEPLTDNLRTQLDEAEHQRQLLESELDQVRQRGAELSDALAEQKRLAADERQRWADELRQLRGAVDRQTELLGHRSNGHAPPVDAAPAAGEEAHEKNNNRVLDSVLEQFEKIQKSKVRKLASSS